MSRSDTRQGLPNPLQLAVLMRAYHDEVRLARPSPAIQSLLFNPLAIVGRLLGYRSSDPRYSAGSDRPADEIATG